MVNVKSLEEVPEIMREFVTEADGGRKGSSVNANRMLHTKSGKKNPLQIVFDGDF